MGIILLNRGINSFYCSPLGGLLSLIGTMALNIYLSRLAPPGFLLSTLTLIQLILKTRLCEKKPRKAPAGQGRFFSKPQRGTGLFGKSIVQKFATQKAWMNWKSVDKISLQ